ncbi:MAG: DUF3082 domain-containing protein [Cyanobacteria bacterium J06559_1]
MEKSTDPTDISKSLDNALDNDTPAAGETPPTPLRCFGGALTAAGFSVLAYRLLLSVSASFANKPITSTNPIAVNISAAVRTLVTGMVALGAGVFGVAALGLTGLGIQLLLKGNSKAEVNES